MGDYHYLGTELDVFAGARNWKRYLAAQMAPFVSGDVLEVGAGIGAITQTLERLPRRTWTCLEPDAGLAQRLSATVGALAGPSRISVVIGALRDLPSAANYDCLLYVDVLEHIEKDHAEAAAAVAMLRSGGHLIVLCPAHNWLYTPFDQAIGHYRRYNRRRFQSFPLSSARLVRLRYLDSVGLGASLGNRLFLRSASPTEAQVRFWDRVLVRASVLLDPLLGYRVGKSILGVWRKA
jgi:protein-L-isoaspartate O-methyltransferase